MKLLAYAVLFAYSMAMPQHLVLPRLPISVIANGNYQLIPESKIVGGTVVEPNSIPFQVALQRRDSTGSYSLSCGGSILDTNVILDASHCVNGANITNLRIVAGEHNLAVVSGIEQIRDVARIITHENFDFLSYENDIALIFLDSPLDFSLPSVRPINLPPPTSELDPTPGTIVTASGWGATSFGGSLSAELRSVDIPVVSDSDCDKAYGGTPTFPQVFPSMMCAGDTSKGGIDSCNGDSGGPLFIGTGVDAVQLGIVSWGKGCALAAFPGVYTQVSYFLDWITANRNN